MFYEGRLMVPLDNPKEKKLQSSVSMKKATLETELENLETLVKTLQDVHAIDESLRVYKEAVEKANALLDRLASAKLDIQTHQIKTPS